MTALILLAHGSPDPRAAPCTHHVAERVQACWPEGQVIAAFIEHDEPRLDEAVRRLEVLGEDDIIIVPLLLSRAFHGRVDVPNAVAAVRETSSAAIRCAEVIGADEELLPALERGLPAAVPVVLAVAGTNDAAAQQDLDRLAGAWSLQRGAPVIVGHASQASPDITAAIASFVLFEGVLPDRIRAAAGSRCVTTPLFTSPELTRLVINRAQAARTSVAGP